MIGVVFEQLDGKVLDVRIEGSKILLRHSDYGAQFFPLKQAFVYEKSKTRHPEIEGKSSWRDILDEKIKKKLETYKTEQGKMKYVVREFKRQGYKPLYYQVEGHRAKRFYADDN